MLIISSMNKFEFGKLADYQLRGPGLSLLSISACAMGDENENAPFGSSVRRLATTKPDIPPPTMM
jgi:hypothetical protein